MELINHIGIRHNSGEIPASFYIRVKGFMILGFLLSVIIGYVFVTVCCNLAYSFFPESSDRIKFRLSHMFWEMCIFFLKLNNVRIEVEGDEILDDSAIVICNHRSLADYIIMAYLAKHSLAYNKSHDSLNDHLFLPRINFFTWFKIWRVPSFRVLYNIAKCDENWELEQNFSERAFSCLVRSKLPEWIILFPEVNIWTEENHSLQECQCKKFFLPNFRHLLYPRFSGFYNVLSTLKKKKCYKYTKLYDLTLLYENRATAQSSQDGIKNSLLQKHILEQKFSSPTLRSIFSSNYETIVHVLIKTKQLNRIPSRRNKMEKWLEKNWIAKDKTLEKMSESIVDKNS